MLPRSAFGALLLLLGLTAIACTRGGGDTAAQLRDADTAMNAVAAQIEGGLSGETKQRFVEAEQAWLAYRDANCDAVKALHDGSSDQPSAEAACLARLTNERRVELERVYKRD